jgi:RimJ/RimL family protein N-acetyltransferase
MDTQVVASFTSKKGNDVVFRYPTLHDFDDLFTFACDIGSEDTFVALDAPPTEDEEHAYLTNLIERIEQKKAIYFMVYVNGKIAGNGQVDIGKGRHSHSGNIGIALMQLYRGEGIGTELMKSLIDEAKKLGLRLLTLTCFETNGVALHVYEKLGFVKAGVIPGAIMHKGQYIGEVHYYLPLVNG